MTTINQLVTRIRKIKQRISKVPALAKCPQKKGVCVKVYVRTPKKPNSALRKVANVRLSNGFLIPVYIPGEKHNLVKFSTVLIRGGKTQDVPGLKYKMIRGKFDLEPVMLRKNGRSKYGTKRWKI